jgi:glycosyltransferase involved in cell wall biosynthesis
LSVLHVLPGAGWGGAEFAVLRLVAAERARGLDSRVWVMKRSGALIPHFRANGIPFATGGAVRALLTGSSGLFPDPGPDVVVGWLYPGNLAAARLVGRRAGLLWNVLQANLDPAVNTRLSRWTMRLGSYWAGRGPLRVVCNSVAARDAHVRAGYPANKMTVIPNGVDIDRFRPDPRARAAFRKSLGIASDDLVVGHLARWDPQKDHRTLVRAVGEAWRRGWRGRMLLAGPGVDEANETLTAWIHASGAAEAFHRLGAVEDAAAFFASVDVACLSSVGESSSYALAEAMACEAACLSTDVGDVREVLAGVGRVVPPGDPAAFADALMALCAAPDRAELGRRARRRVEERFSFTTFVNAYLQLYRDAVDHRRAARAVEAV